MSDGLARMLAPRTVAVVGASPNAGKAGNALMRSLTGFEGVVHPIHPKADVVLGRRAYADIGAVSGQVDLALLAVPAPAVPGAVAACAAAGVGGVVVHAGGFAEVGAEGRALQRATAEAAVGSGTRILGPNTSGFIAPHLRLSATFVACASEICPGPLAIVAQSGGVNHALAFGAAADGLGVRLAVGLGNAVDLGFAEILDHIMSDDGVGVVALAIEGLADGRALTSAIERLVDRVPVVALKLGRSDVSAFAQSHTGALTGSYDVTRAALRQAGAVVVDDTTALLDAARTLSARRLPPMRAPGIGVVTGQAGPGLLLADALAAEGVRVPELSQPVQQRLSELLGDLTFVRNPVDTGRPGPTFSDVLATVAAAHGIDALAVYLLDEPDAIDPRVVLDAENAPIVLGTAGPPPEMATRRDDLARIGVTVMPSPERTATAVAALARDAAGRIRGGAEVRAPETGDLLGAEWDEARSKKLVSRLGLGTPPARVCTAHDDALVAAERIGFPVVLKLLHREMTHKTEHGAVKVGLRDARDVLDALAALDEIPLPSAGRYLVEAMVPEGPELIIGAVRDVVFGPLVMLGAGGIDTEILRDTTTRLAPLSVDEASTMLDELATASRYRGHRGTPAVDEEQLALAIAQLGATIAARDDLAEIEVNPVRVTARGLLALDALVVPTHTQVSHA